MPIDAEGIPQPVDNADPIVGIDLGTTNSLVAYCDEGGPRILEDDSGLRLLPSVVRFGEDETVVGAPALASAITHAARTISSAKRLLGRGAGELAESTRRLPYTVISGPRDLAAIDLDGRIVTPQEVSAHILAKLRTIAEASLGVRVTRAVVTVPAYFDDTQRNATRDAARLAGIDVVRVVNEPTAAALAYGLGERGDSERTVVVYDLGGGTFDVSLLRLLPPDGKTESLVEVVATAGDTQLGGDDFDALIEEEILRQAGIDVGIRGDLSPGSRQALSMSAQQAKIMLSEVDSTTILLETEDSLLPEAIEVQLTRESFEAMIQPLLERTIDACRRVLSDGRVDPGDVDRVLLVGGSTRVPSVRAAVGDFFGCDPYVAIDPDEVVALGAAVQASILAGDRRDLLLLDVIPLSLGIETLGGAVAKLLVRNSSIPARAGERFSTSVDGQTSVKIHVMQGERELVEHCRSLGVFHLSGIPSMPAGIPRIEVDFIVDADGVLSVHAVEMRSGRRASIQLVPSYGLTAREVEEIEASSFVHAREDMHAHRVIDLGVNAALDVKWISEALQRMRGELESTYVTRLESLMREVGEFVENARQDPRSVDAEAFHASKERLDQESIRLHEAAIAASLRSDDD